MISFRPQLFVFACCLVGCAGQTTTPVAVSAAAPFTPVAAPAPATAATPATVAVAPPPASNASVTANVTKLIAEAVALPGAVAPVSLDYLFFEAQASRVWVPAGGTGSVDVFDVAKRELTRIEGFKTAERVSHGKKRTLGPSAGAVGDGFAYIGNRATQEVCSINLTTLKKSVCITLPVAIDGVEYVASTHEVWVTAPDAHSLLVLATSNKGDLKSKTVIKVDGEPEGYAVDESRGLFLTNLEDKGTTLSIDIQTHEVRDTWNAACSADGPRGIAVDSARRLLLVACTDHVQALDMAHGGALLAKLDTGAGLDNIGYVPATRLLYAAAGKAARLTVARVGDKGDFTVVASAETAEGARNAVADASGTVYVADPRGAHLLVLRDR